MFMYRTKYQKNDTSTICGLNNKVLQDEYSRKCVRKFMKTLRDSYPMAFPYMKELFMVTSKGFKFNN